MRMNALAYAAINQLTLISLRLEPCTVPAGHRYIMQPAAVERFVYITRGSAVFSLTEGKLSVCEKDMIYLPRDTAYVSNWQENAEFMVVDILLRDSEGQDIRFDDAPGVLFNDVHGVYASMLHELAEKAEAKGPFDWLERMSLALKFLCEIARDTNSSELSEKYRRILHGVTYLESNFAEDFSVEDLARMCALSVGSFRRLFFECKGMSPVDYRNSLRIKNAATLLKTGRYTVHEAAEAVGIQDIKYFGKLFRRYIGVSPSALKKKGLENGAAMR